MESEVSGVECFWGSLKDNPKCPHGPTLLFGKRVDGKSVQFYSCSACRDRKICNFYLEKGESETKIQKAYWQLQTKNFILPYSNHRRFFIKFNELLMERPENRVYCHLCERLISLSEKGKHENHEMTIGLTDEQMNNPTSLLKPLSNPKKEAQYMFSKKALVDIVKMLDDAGAKHVLCIGAPRIHEYLSQNHEGKISSLLLDFDARFHNFYGPLNFCWYNLFNHHFFNGESKDVFKDFMTQDKGRNMFLICDPPFGGRLEYISQTIKRISNLHKSWNGLKDGDPFLKIFFIFPYFMEPAMQIKANPQGVSGGLKELKMADYKVDYDNHPLFISGSGGRKFGSPVRIFTNLPLNLLKFPEEDGYKYCKRCDKWVSAENKHCKKCKSCTSKDGRRYRHCNICARCVKPTWKHCKKCERCLLELHTCGAKPKITGQCFKCKSTDHTEKDCSANLPTKKRRKADSDELPKKKKQKIENGAPVDKLEKKKKKKNRVDKTNKIPIRKIKNLSISSEHTSE